MAIEAHQAQAWKEKKRNSKNKNALEKSFSRAFRVRCLNDNRRSEGGTQAAIFYILLRVEKLFKCRALKFR